MNHYLVTIFTILHIVSFAVFSYYSWKGEDNKANHMLLFSVLLYLYSRLG